MKPVSMEQLRRPTIVIAPHQDDEVLGCGGTISQLRRWGIPVTILFLCDGANSHSKKMAPDKMAALRKEEALAAAKVMGIAAQDIFFIPVCNQGASANHEEIDKRLMPVLQNRPADNYFIPYRYEQQADHSATTTISLNAIKRLHNRALILEYPIWFWEHKPWMNCTIFSPKGMRQQLIHTARSLLRLFMHFNHYVDVTETLDQKTRALGEYKSQMTRLQDDPTWPILHDVSDGDFLNCFNREREIFSTTFSIGRDNKQ